MENFDNETDDAAATASFSSSQPDSSLVASQHTEAESDAVVSHAEISASSSAAEASGDFLEMPSSSSDDEETSHFHAAFAGASSQLTSAADDDEEASGAETQIPSSSFGFGEEAAVATSHNQNNSRSFKCEWSDCTCRELTISRLSHHVNEEHIKKRKQLACEWNGCFRKGIPLATRFALISHVRKHTGDKPFQCPVVACARCFSRSDALAKHVKSHEEADEEAMVDFAAAAAEIETQMEEDATKDAIPFEEAAAKRKSKQQSAAAKKPKPKTEKGTRRRFTPPNTAYLTETPTRTVAQLIVDDALNVTQKVAIAASYARHLKAQNARMQQLLLWMHKKHASVAREIGVLCDEMRDGGIKP